MKGLAAGVAGFRSNCGVDRRSARSRFYWSIRLLDGVDFIVLTVALFGIGEVLASCSMASAADSERRA